MRILPWLLASSFVSSFATAQVPAVEVYGAGCGGQGGQPATIDIVPAMRPGFFSTLQLDNLTPNTMGILWLGNSDSQWQGLSLPYALDSFGMPGCSALTGPIVQVPFFTGGGDPAASFYVPPDPIIAAANIYMQAFFDQPGLNAINLGTTRGVRGRVAPLPTPTTQVTSISQWGITFTFAQPVPAGQFANGDWFVIGPATITDMQPPCVNPTGTRVLNGAMINPDPSVRDHGYDGFLYGAGNEWLYHDSLNVALNLSAANPLVLQPNQSLIKSVSNLNAALVPQLDTCAVLTCLASSPPDGSFRPPYSGPDHQVHFDVDMIDWDALQSLAPPTGMPSITTQATLIERPWLDHCPGWGSRMMHPVQNMPDYGRDFASLYGEAALMAHTNLPLLQRRELVIRLVQIGIDFWANVKNGCFWEGVGGHGSGRKLPILFAGALLGDVEMLGVGQNYRSERHLNGTYTTHFGEDCQTFYVEQTAPNQINWGYGSYTSAYVGLPEFGFSHVHEPSSDHSGWYDDSYRRCCTANAWVSAVLCARMMGLVSAWDHQALFDYQERYMQIETTGWTRSWSTWSGKMWDAYRPMF